MHARSALTGRPTLELVLQRMAASGDTLWSKFQQAGSTFNPQWVIVGRLDFRLKKS